MKKLLLNFYLKTLLAILNIRIHLVSSDLEYMKDFEYPEKDIIKKQNKLNYLLTESSKTHFLIDILK